MQNDMTKGSPLRLIVFFTIPVLLGNIFQNVYNLMDSIIVAPFLGPCPGGGGSHRQRLTSPGALAGITGTTAGFGIPPGPEFRGGR